MPEIIRRDSRDADDPKQSESLAPLEYDKLHEEWTDNPQFARNILLSFMRETQSDIETLTASFDANDAGRVVRTAHRLKGAAAIIGAGLLRVESERIEALGRQGQLAAACKNMNRLAAEFQRFCSYVNKLLTPPE